MHNNLSFFQFFQNQCKTKFLLAYFNFLIFSATFGGEKSVTSTRAPYGMGPSNPTKKLAHSVDLLGQSLSRNHVFEIVRMSGVTPLKAMLHSSQAITITSPCRSIATNSYKAKNITNAHIHDIEVNKLSLNKNIKIYYLLLRKKFYMIDKLNNEWIVFIHKFMDSSIDKEITLINIIF